MSIFTQRQVFADAPRKYMHFMSRQCVRRDKLIPFEINRPAVRYFFFVSATQSATCATFDFLKTAN